MRRFFIFLLFLLSSCIIDYYDSRLIIINQSDIPICVETFNDTIPDYPMVNHPEVYLQSIIQVGDTAEKTISGLNAWPQEVKRSKNNKLNIFIYNPKHVRDYYNMDSLNKAHKYRIISLSLNELESKKWQVIIK